MDQVIDRPFGLPELITHTIDLPFPPSANRLWRYAHGRKGTVYLSTDYKVWLRRADMRAMAQRIKFTRQIAGAFEATIYLLSGASKMDGDNVVKPILDWAQRCGLIKNDRHCRRFIVEWTDKANAPDGARLILREMVP